MKAEIIAALPAPTKAEAARKIAHDRDDVTFRRAWDDLYEAGTITAESGRWVVVVPPDPNGGKHHHTLRLIEGEGSVG